MTYRPSTEPGPARSRAELTLEATRYLHELGIDPETGKIALADALYRLVGADSERVKAALALLELVEAARQRSLFVHFAPDDGYVAGDVSVSHAWDSRDTVASEVVRKPERDIGDACRRLLAQLKDGAP